MAEEQKPAVTAETAAPVTEPTPAPAEALTSEAKPSEIAAPAVEEPKTETTAEGAATTEAKKEEKPVEPITSGVLGYKAPGLVNSFRFSKKYFWFGEEPVSVQDLSQYLRGEKPEVAHATAAWSSQTGKGLLYFVKHADQKKNPAGVLNLADATDVTKDGTQVFFFKLGGHKHSFEASSVSERNGWFLALEKAVEDAKAAKEGVVSSESYKEELKKLGKPAALAATAAKAEGSTPKKSTDATPKPAEATEEGAAPARTGSASSSSADEDKKKKKSKSRSVSRGKRASIFGGLLAKKDKAEEKVAEKKEEKKEDKAEGETKKEETPAAEASTAAPIVSEEPPKPVEEPKAEETPVATTEAAATEEKKTEEKKPKPTKRGSIFGNFVEKLKSPTTEKKESEVAPPPPAKEGEIPAEAPKIEEAAAAAPATEAATEAPKTEEAKETKPAATTPHKEKEPFSFGKFLGGGKEKVKSPTTETAPKVEEPAKAEETPAAAESTEAPKEEKKEELGVTSTASATPAPKAKRGSIFGNLTGSVKKEKEGEASGEKKENKLTGLFRNASKSVKPSKKEKEATSTPGKVEETAEPKEEAKTEEPAKEEKKEETAAPAEPKAIGDVVPDAVTVGQAPKSTPEVSATA